MANKGILLVNLGSPDSPNTADVRRYLKQFLMDGHVIDIPYPLRAALVYGIIAPFRSPKSAEAYQQIWRDEGSPLAVISQMVASLLKEKVDAPIALGMRYGNPSAESAIKELLDQGIDSIYMIPLYPHYAASSTLTAIEEVQRVLKKLAPNTALKICPPFYGDEGYIDSLVEASKPFLNQPYERLLFSYHGLPERHISNADPTGHHCLSSPDCCEQPSEAHATCYRYQVLATSHLFAAKAGIEPRKCMVSFQSRLGRAKWLLPNTEELLRTLPSERIKRLVVICPSFVADCLETLEEIAIRGKELFLSSGGESFELIPCMNTHEHWIDTLAGWCNHFLD